jgi:enolase-phosphatase E1
MAVRAIVTDIEGTTTPISFVHNILFPFSRERLAAFCQTHAAEPQIAKALQDARELAGNPQLDLKATIQLLDDWIVQDKKLGPLKLIQGLIWRDGYREGLLQGEIYPDAAAHLRRWHARGYDLYIYSSGSEDAQRLIFGHSDQGDLVPLFSGFFDTRIGGKIEAASYRKIADKIRVVPSETLFLTDAPAEVSAATEAGLQAVQIDRALAPDALKQEQGVTVAGSFVGVEQACGLQNQA